MCSASHPRASDVIAPGIRKTFLLLIIFSVKLVAVSQLSFKFAPASDLIFFELASPSPRLTKIEQKLPFFLYKVQTVAKYQQSNFFFIKTDFDSNQCKITYLNGLERDPGGLDMVVDMRYS